MKQIVAALLLLAGSFLLFQFVLQGTVHAGGEAASIGLPFSSLGKNYPADALYLVGAFWCLLLSFVLTLTAGVGKKTSGDSSGRYSAAPRSGGRVARFMLLNSLFLLSSLFVAFIGARTGQETPVVAIFGCVALAQTGLGLLLVILSLIEKPKGIASLIFGLVLYLGGGTLTVLSFAVWGGA